MWVATVLLYAVLETTYLSLTAKRMYSPMFSKIQGGVQPSYRRLYFALIAYACIAVAWFAFVYRVMRTKNIINVITNATVLALAIYGVYNATNLVTFDKWDTTVAICDTIWGIIVFNVVSLSCYAMMST